MKFTLKQKQKGFTLIELLLVIGLIAVASLVVFIAYPKVKANAKANEEATTLNTIAAGITGVYASSNNFTSLGNDGTTAINVLNISKALPEKIINGASLVNGFSGAITITYDNIPSTDTTNAYYRIQYDNVPQAECVKLTSGVGNNFVQVSVGGTAVANMVKTNGDVTTIDPGIAVEKCNATFNTIYFWGK